MYCPKCLPEGPKDAGQTDKTGKFVKASVEARYHCDVHNDNAQLDALNNGYYKCHCGWTNQPKVK